MAKVRLVGILFVLTCFTAGLARADIAGSADHPKFPRFAGSEIIGQLKSDYDEFILALGMAYEHAMSDYRLKDSRKVEGRVTRTLYLLPPEKSTLQVFRNYEKTLKELGLETLFTCTGSGECGWRSWFTGVQTLGGLREYALQVGDDFRYLSAAGKVDGADTTVSLLVYKYDSSVIAAWSGRTMVEIGIIEGEPMKTEMVVVKAADLAKGIRDEGHAAVHQILFDTDSAAIKPESKASIDEIAMLLKDNPDMKVILVGHTDNQGGLQHNMDLSHARAKAVRTELETKYGIASDRLGAAGVGFLAPMANNATEEGRAKNRRVEIIEQ